MHECCIKFLFEILHKSPRRDAGAVDRGGLENRCALTGTQGSNPCLSAIEKEAVSKIGAASFYVLLSN